MIFLLEMHCKVTSAIDNMTLKRNRWTWHKDSNSGIAPFTVGFTKWTNSVIYLSKPITCLRNSFFWPPMETYLWKILPNTVMLAKLNVSVLGFIPRCVELQHILLGKLGGKKGRRMEIGLHTNSVKNTTQHTNSPGELRNMPHNSLIHYSMLVHC